MATIHLIQLAQAVRQPLLEFAFRQLRRGISPQVGPHLFVRPSSVLRSVQPEAFVLQHFIGPGGENYFEIYLEVFLEDCPESLLEDFLSVLPVYKFSSRRKDESCTKIIEWPMFGGLIAVSCFMVEKNLWCLAASMRMLNEVSFQLQPGRMSWIAGSSPICTAGRSDTKNSLP